MPNNPHNEDYQVLVSAQELAQLQRSDVILHALFRHGVDNWDFYDDAMAEADEI